MPNICLTSKTHIILTFPFKRPVSNEEILTETNKQLPTINTIGNGEVFSAYQFMKIESSDERPLCYKC